MKTVVSLVLCASLAFVAADIILPKGFKLGTATASYQIEGAVKEDGRGPSIWDVFSHTPGKTHNGDTGDVACDHYHRLEEDIAIMKQMGLKNYRMSLSWSRLLPNGTTDYINQKGIDYYNREIDLLVKNGISVFVTLYHWDLPQVLHERHGGWLNTSMIVKAYNDYADLAFRSFGDRVKHWITFNEAWCSSVLGYLSGVHAPGRCTGCKPEGGDSTYEPYRVAHSIILSHAMAVNTFRTKYKTSQNGFIGMTMNSDWSEPYSNSAQDVEAAERNMQFTLGWFADPIFFGDYPATMRQRCGDRLPVFTSQEKLLLLSAKSDFFGLNHYSSGYIAAQKPGDQNSNEHNYFSDIGVFGTKIRDGKPIGPVADSDWLYVVPWGIRKILNWIGKRYPGVDIFVTENGCDVPNETLMPLEQALNDTFRVNYVNDYMTQVSLAIQDGVPVKGYFVWSLMVRIRVLLTFIG
jgi:beta-glucosidase